MFDLSASPAPAQVANLTTSHSRVLTPGEGRYQAVQPLWEGSSALVAWMSDGLRVFDLSTPTSPKARAFYVPPAMGDPTGNYATVPLVTGIAKFGERFVITDINGGLYVLNVVLHKDHARTAGTRSTGSPTRAAASTSLTRLADRTCGGCGRDSPSRRRPQVRVQLPVRAERSPLPFNGS